jgi:DNA-nicking Smr family endonuclease
MARRKTSHKKFAVSQGDNNSPFKSLKGLSVSGKQPSSATASSKDCGTDTGPCPDCDDQHAFAEEMDILGVKPLSGRRDESVGLDKRAAGNSFETPGQSRHERDTAVFLEAVSDITKICKNDGLDSTPFRRGAARRMKQLERGQLKPEAVVDLHGLTIDEATSKVHFFLQNAVHQNLRTLLIITGKGLHSGDGPVLKEAVQKLLGQSVDSVIEWGIAPRRYGGSGALVVFLRGNASE